MSLSNWLHILETIGPAVLAFTPAAPFIPAVLAGIKLAESSGGTGAEKKQLAIETAAQIATSVNQVTGKPAVNPAQLAAVTGTAIDTVVGVVNLTQQAATDVQAPKP